MDPFWSDECLVDNILIISLACPVLDSQNLKESSWVMMMMSWSWNLLNFLRYHWNSLQPQFSIYSSSTDSNVTPPELVSFFSFPLFFVICGGWFYLFIWIPYFFLLWSSLMILISITLTLSFVCLFWFWFSLAWFFIHQISVHKISTISNQVIDKPFYTSSFTFLDPRFLIFFFWFSWNLIIIIQTIYWPHYPSLTKFSNIYPQVFPPLATPFFLFFVLFFNPYHHRQWVLLDYLLLGWLANLRFEWI